jgi:putative OmpL-like beta-barrel porin-2
MQKNLPVVLSIIIALVAVPRLPRAQETAQATPAAQPAPPAPPPAPPPPPPPPGAAPPAAPAPKWYDTIALNAFVSTSYQFDFNRPLPVPPDTTGRIPFRVFDQLHNSFTVDVAELVLHKDANDPGDWGFRFDMVAGTILPLVSGAVGLNLSGNFDLQQAFVSYVGPAKLKFDAGKFVTPMGMEVIEGYDGYNDNFSHSWLFGFTIPFTHVGIRATYPFSDQVSLLVMLVNGWDNAIDNNDLKTLGFLLTANPTPALSILFNYCVGPEQLGNNSNIRNMFDLAVTYKATPTLQLGLDADFGHEDNAVITGSANWGGVAGYARVDFNPKMSLALRAEFFDDADGFRTNTGPGGLQLFGVTATPIFKLTDHFILRPELRADFSTNVDAFTNHDGGATGVQVTAALNALVFI